MNRPTACTLALAVTVCFGCKPMGEPKVEIDEALLEHVSDTPPKEMETRRFVDFGGKVHLLGYDLETTGEPGSNVDVTFYWKSVGRLGPGWGLFTHLVNEHGHRIQNYDARGPLRQQVKNDDGTERQALPPSLWKPGKYYVDPQQFQIPQPGSAPWHENVTTKVSLVVGVWKGDMRLEVLSGPSDDENAGIVAHLSTGLERPARVFEDEDEDDDDDEEDEADTE